MGSSKRHESKEYTLATVLRWCGRISAISLLGYSPWIYGMVTWSQQLLLLPWITSIILFSGLAAVLDRNHRVSLNPFFLSLMCLIGFAVIQLMPLTETLFQRIAPAAAFERNAVSLAAEYLAVDANSPELLAASAETGPLFKTLSIHPLQTQASLVGLASAVALMFCSGILFHDRAGRMLLLIAIAIISTVVSTVGILQNISWNQWTLLEMPYGRGFATFVSRNSAPQYIALGIGCTIACATIWLKRKRKGTRSLRRYRPTTALGRLRRNVEDISREIDPAIIILLVCMVLQIGGVVGAASRGGFVALLFALAGTIILMLGRRRQALIPGLAALTITALLLLFFVSAFELDEDIARRLEMQGLESPARLEFWKLALSQPEFWLTGSGLGNFHFAILPADKVQINWIYHAESIYVELISEFGWLFAAVSLSGFIWLVLKLLGASRAQRGATWPAALYSTLAIGLQSAVDFSLIIPAIFLTMSAVIGAYLAEAPRESHEIRRPRRKTLDAWMVASVSAILLLVLWQGSPALKGFAQGERLNSIVNAAGEDYDSDTQLRPEELLLWHPEVALQLSRRKVNTIQVYLQQLPDWDDEVSILQRDRFSQLEFVSAVLRSEDPASLGNFYETWNSDERLLASIAAAQSGFEFMSRHCIFDWRGHWGLFQTTVERDPVKHSLTCARLRNLTVSIPRLQQSVATCSLIAGDRSIGLDFWKTSLAYHPKQTHRLSQLVGPWLDVEDLNFILPDSEIAKTILARSLEKTNESEVILDQLIEQLDLNRLKQEVVTVDEWELFVWLAGLLGEKSEFIDGLRTIASRRPMDKSVRLRLARALEANGEIEEAIALLEQASRRSLLNAADERYLNQLRQAPPK